ncbi:MAG: 2-phospho-L-lactate guanylyltransferase [Candidatus Rokubacteria bacterium]|nr:2-phospho-L-lactate guanylyltransferase [Candidatus Rokubacteria bacterium]
MVVAVPVKDLVNAKQRLARALGPAERAALARAMLEDVLTALAAARLDAVWVVTRDDEAAALARGFGAEVLAEAENRGHTSAVAFAQAHALARGARCFATIPGDVPCVTAAEIRALADATGAADRVCVFTPSRSGLGTNGAALVPPDAMPLTFGEPSFDNHLAAARARGLTPRVLPLPGLGLDVDAPEDLAALLDAGGHTASGRLVAGWKLAPAARA